MREADLNLQLKAPEDTEALGAALARTFAGLTPAMTGDGAVVHLRGELGAGKTTLVRSFLRTLGVAGLVRSPTYTLVEPYPVGDSSYVHVDLYRLRSPVDLEDLGLRDYLVPGNLLLIEWPEKGGAAVPPPDLELTLVYQAAGREVGLHAGSEFGEVWLDILGHDTSLFTYLSNLT
jgi:tRNA threonylcarbamoyladenosine biosynthesis protein TsaE